MFSEQNPEKNILNQVDNKEGERSQANLNEVRKFTKEQFPEERKKIAEQLMTIRKEARIEELLSLAEKKEVSNTEAVQEVQGIESSLEKSKNNGVLELEDSAKIKEVREKIGVPVSQGAFEEEYDKAQSLTDKFEFVREREDKLGEARAILDRFYQDKSKAWTEYREDKEARKVENLMIKNNAFVAHVISDLYVSSSRLSIEADALIRLKIALGLEPSLSASSTKEENGINSFLHSSGDEDIENIVKGIILKGGKITSAQSYDAWTRPVGLKRTATGNTNVEDINKEMQRVRKDYGYNELVVDSPKAAGYFITFREGENVHKVTTDKAIEEFKYVKQLGMPLYAIKEGAVFKADFDEASGVYSCSDEKLSPEELANNGFELSDEKKGEIIKEVIDASIFNVKKLELEEADYFDSAAKGREAYVLINSQKKESHFGGEHRPLESFWEAKSAEGTHLEFKPGEEYLQISRIPGVGKDSYYGLKDGKLYNLKRNRRTNSVSSHEIDEQHLKSDTMLALGAGEEFKVKEPAYKDNESYFGAIKDALLFIKEKGSKEKLGKCFREAAFNLYGFAAEAEKFGDEENAQKARVLATELMPEEEYKKLIAERSDERGNFKLKKEDLK